MDDGTDPRQIASHAVARPREVTLHQLGAELHRCIVRCVRLGLGRSGTPTAASNTPNTSTA